MDWVIQTLGSPTDELSIKQRISLAAEVVLWATYSPLAVLMNRQIHS